MGRPTKAEKAAKAAAKAAEEAAKEKPNLDGKTCADCTRGKQEDYHGLASVRCTLRPFLQRAWQQACPDCQL